MPKITRLSLLLILLFISKFSYCQTYVDSLKAAYKKGDDKTKYTLITHILPNLSHEDKEYGYYVEQTKLLADRNLAKSSLTSSQKQFWKLAKGDYFIKKATIFQTKNPPEALKLVNKSIEVFTELKSFSKLADALVGKGMLLIDTGKTPEGIESYYKALKYYDQLKDKSGVAYAQITIANAYNSQKKYEEGLALYQKALTYYLTVKKPVVDDKAAITALYQNIGHYYFLKKKYDTALEYFNKGLIDAKEIGHTGFMSILLDKIGRIHFERKEYELAYQKFQQALQLEQPDVYKANLYTSIGELCIAQKKYQEAEDYLNKAVAIGKQYGDLEMQFYAVDHLTQLYKKTKRFEKALEMSEIYNSLDDSIVGDESRNTLKEQQLKYEFEKKELKAKITQQKKISEIKARRNILITILSALLLLVLSGGFFYYRNNKQKQEIAGLEKNQIKQKLLITQMNPHFIFNSIGNIQGLINDKKDKDAVDYLTKFSKLTRQILENSNENYISLEEEVEMTKNYLSIQQLLYSNKFSFKIDIEDNVDTENIFLPPMLTQPFIENAIKHGISNTENGKIDIRFYLKEGKLFFEVTDNGRGFDASKRTDNHKSLAMTITKERLVNYTRNQDFVVHTDNIKDNNEKVVGAKVSFEIPYIYEN